MKWWDPGHVKQGGNAITPATKGDCWLRVGPCGRRPASRVQRTLPCPQAAAVSGSDAWCGVQLACQGRQHRPCGFKTTIMPPCPWVRLGHCHLVPGSGWGAAAPRHGSPAAAQSGLGGACGGGRGPLLAFRGARSTSSHSFHQSWQGPRTRSRDPSLVMAGPRPQVPGPTPRALPAPSQRLQHAPGVEPRPHSLLAAPAPPGWARLLPPLPVPAAVPFTACRRARRGLQPGPWCPAPRQWPPEAVGEQSGGGLHSHHRTRVQHVSS
jgi:hypothetical protein